ncbi:MAG: hypothetical protein ACQERC_12500 [Bacteroidota bacterium]
MKIVVAFLILLSCSMLLGQSDHFLTPQNKAYLYHTVRKSPILEKNIGRYIKYHGEAIELPNGEINYDSTEQVIINQPELLTIYQHELRKAPKGILAEAANKMALWELNKTLKHQRSGDLAHSGMSSYYEEFETLLIKELPESALRQKDNGLALRPRIEKLYNPTLTFNDKVAMLDGFGKWNNDQKKQVIQAYSTAINKWVEIRAYSIFKSLGGESTMFHNVLTAAGDGSNTSGMFEEREKDERGRWNKGLPKAVGLFPYEPYIGKKQTRGAKKQEVLPRGNTFHYFETPGEGKKTNIHLDVWGYNSDKQTTVVLEKGGRYYPLFGSSETRFLSPDSTFGGDLTYYTLINRVRADIAALEEKVSGRRGLEYWIDYHDDRRKDKLLEIDKVEKELNDIRYSTITTDDKKYKTDSKKKKRKKRQEKVVLYYSQLESIKKKIRELKAEKEEVLTKKQALNRKLQNMYDLIGTEWVSFEENDGFYLFEDSSRFDIQTQEFTFPPSDDKEKFQVKLLAIPLSHQSQQFDEVMLHINVADAEPFYTAQLRLNMNDVFASDDFSLEKPRLITPEDSIGVMEFFEAMQNDQMYFNIIARGQGIGQMQHDQLVSHPEPEVMDAYPGVSSDEKRRAKESIAFKQLRTTEVTLFVDRCITLEVNSYTDPVKSNFTPPSSAIAETMEKYDLSKNEVLSGYRTYATLKQLKEELNILAGDYLDRPDAKAVIDRLNKAIEKTSITMGKTSFKFDEF